MSKGNKEFLSKVRYIITKDEAKYFKNLPDEQRGHFITQFWEIRDPDPSTEENEFEFEYLQRIDDANRLFTAGRDGWLTDRGMTYILLGPPRHVSNHPLGAFSPDPLRSKPYEVWHYPEIYLIFVDHLQDGDYKVEYSGMTHHAYVQEAFIEAKRELKYLNNLFNYKFAVKRIEKKPFLIFTFEVDKLSFKEKDDKMISQMEIKVIARDKKYNDAWNYEKRHTIEFGKNERIPKKIEIKVPMELSKGRYFFFTSVRKMDEKEQNRVFQNKLAKIK